MVELVNVMAGAGLAASEGAGEQVGLRPVGLCRYLEMTGRHTVGERLQHLAMTAAGDDLLERAETVNAAAVVYFRQARYRLVKPMFEEALAASTEAGGPAKSIGAVLSNLGDVHQRLGDSAGTLGCYERCGRRGACGVSLVRERCTCREMRPCRSAGVDG